MELLNRNNLYLLKYEIIFWRVTNRIEAGREMRDKTDQQQNCPGVGISIVVVGNYLYHDFKHEVKNGLSNVNKKPVTSQ